jgi:molybdenum cofactor guanylyltransferase
MVMTQNGQINPHSLPQITAPQDASQSDRTATIVGVLLSGGQSRRMGGGDKALRDLDGQPMLAHVINRLRPQVGPLVINANGDPDRFAAFGLPVASDTIDGFVGPLAGVLAGMLWAKTNAPGARWIATVSTDAPFLPDDLVMRLAQSVCTRPGAIAIAQSGGEVHPVIGLWPVAHASDLEQALRDGVRKVLAWTDRHGTVPVDFPFQVMGDRSVDPFFNANHPEELEEARRLFACARGGQSD